MEDAEVDDVLRPLVEELTREQREAIRADLAQWSSLLWSPLVDAPERDVEIVRSSLLRLL